MQVPIVSGDLWARISQRFNPVATSYMRKLGVMEKAPRPCSTIDQFFAVKTSDASTAVPSVTWVSSAHLERPEMYRALFQGLCAVCDNALTDFVSEGMIVCRRCGNGAACVMVAPTMGGPISSTERVSAAFGEDNAGPKRVTTYMYKRTNHFIDHLKRVQAKETANIKPCVMEAVVGELAKERLEPGDPRITTNKIRDVLKKLKLQKYYNHVFAITSTLSGKAAPTLTPAQEEKLLSMFRMIQEPFDRVCPPSRTNMISYSYINRKLVEILGWDELIDYFPSLKSRIKVYAQDKIWREICRETGLPFYRTVS